MQLHLDTEVPALTLHLNTLEVPADDYTVQAEVPVRTTVLCDGRVQYHLLRQTHCTLTVTGRLPGGSGSETCLAMQNAMHAHTAFSFEFAGAAFNGMQITALSRKTAKHRMLTEYTVTLIGSMTEVSGA